MTACNNNCRGVDPNDIVGAGAAVVAASALAAVASLVGPGLLLGVGGLAGAGGASMLRTGGQCAPTQCRNRRGQCVNFLINPANPNRPFCPLR